MTKLIKTASFLAIAACFVAAIPAHAQSNCQPINLLLQANLEFSRPIPYFSWSGIVRGFLDNKIPLNGVLHGAGPNPSGGFFAAGQTGHELGVSFVFDFGPLGKLMTLPDKGIFPISPQVAPHMVYPPELAWAPYFYTAKIGPEAATAMFQPSGWFEKATGNLSLNGAFLVNGPATPEVSVPEGPNTKGIGIWNAEIRGKVCNVTPK